MLTSTNFTFRKISLKRAIEILAKNKVEVNEAEAGGAHKKQITLKGNRTY